MQMEKVSYLNQPNCLRLANREIEVLVTTDVGPRIIRYARKGGENVLGEVPETAVETVLGRWKPWGGHRLWAAPEDWPRSYAPDNDAVEYKAVGERALRLRQQTELATGLQKEMMVTIDEVGSGVRVDHRITNRSQTAVEVAPWALTIMRGGGVAILPQEPFRPHSEYLLPARPLVLWHYTNLSDPRWRVGQKFISLKSDPDLSEPQKIGVANKQGWAAYYLPDALFVKRFAYVEGATYPDYGSNNEVFTAGSFIEVESLAPLARLAPGEWAEHVEHWYLFDGVQLGGGDGEAALEAAFGPLIAVAPL